MSPPRSCTYGSAESQLSMLFVIVLLTLLAARVRAEERIYLNVWRQNWFVGVFVCLALVSLSWTADVPATIYRSFLLLSMTAIAAYAGFRFSNSGFVIFVAVVVGVAALASLILAAFLPRAAIMPNPPYVGLWRGIFWHKNYFGATMALGYITYLVILFSPASQFSILQKLLAAVMLLVCATLVLLSDSASGLITHTLQTGLFVLVVIWLFWRHLIPRWAYWVAAGVALVAILLLLANLEFVFGVFNRSGSMTGRIPLWTYLLKTYVSERPWLGHGFGAFWLQPGMERTIQSVQGWGYPVKNSDNGYLDILLGLGITGLVLVFTMLGVGLKRVIYQALVIRDLTSFFPFFLLVHIILINMSLSYFVELESFIWFLLIVVLFISTKYSQAPLHAIEKESI
jgi:O-antigen ligase